MPPTTVNSDSGKISDPSTLVETMYGKVQGVREGSVSVWRGIPYARGTAGPLRFRPPQPPVPWGGVLDATKFGPICPQVNNPLSPTDGLVQSEDCLNLNIWSPAADDKRRPVMVWIHGGAFVFGSGQSPSYDGTSFAAEGDVVVVTINYRLGPLGFLYVEGISGDYAASGNCAMLDQVAALRWVRDNIARFGGDSERVTIFGESAGSMSVGTLLTMPDAKGLFHQAIMQSGLPSMKDRAAASATTERMLSALGISLDDANALGKLQQVPAAALVEASQTLTATSGLTWRPMVDGVSIHSSFLEAVEMGCANDIPTIIGCNLNELTLWTARDPLWKDSADDTLVELFANRWGGIPEQVKPFYLSEQSGMTVREALVQIGSYRTFGAPIQKYANRQVGRSPVWVYRFDWESVAGGGRFKACHSLEIPFVFNNVDKPKAMLLTGDAPSRFAVARQMHQAWIHFAHSGNPNTDEVPYWPAYDLNRRPTMLFNTESKVVDDPYGEERRVWENVFGP